MSELIRILPRVVINKAELNCGGHLFMEDVCAPCASFTATVLSQDTLTCYSLKAQLEVLHLGCSFSTPLKIVFVRQDGVKGSIYTVVERF